MIKKITLAAFTIAMLIAPLSLSAAEHRVVDIVATMDSLYRSESSRAEMKMVVENPHWERTLTMVAWSEGMDRTFIRIESPKKEKGTATLRVGNEMWNYLPKTDKVMKIPPSMMMGSWMGSDFTNDDLVKETSMMEEYTHEIIRPEGAEDDMVYVESVPKEDTPSVWGKIVTAVREEDYLPVWQKFYEEGGELTRIMNYKSIQEMDGREIPTVMELIPQNKEGHRTVIEYIDVEFDVDIDPEIFSLRNLKRKG